jgi:hypothetical protein
MSFAEFLIGAGDRQGQPQTAEPALKFGFLSDPPGKKRSRSVLINRFGNICVFFPKV